LTKPRIKGTPQSLPHAPAEWEVADAGALQALQRGDASEAQQQRALKFIVQQLACTYDLSYRPTGGTEFAEGKRFVGLQIVKLLHLNLSQMTGNNAP
jgi:hypothetical protein